MIAAGATRVGAAVALEAFACGCATIAKGAANVGVISKESATAVEQASEDFNESQEYYIGRSVAATCFASYPPQTDEALNRYVARVGSAVALASDRPETFGGYHFQVLDSDEVNAFAAPGGLIFVTKATVKLCEDEDMLAGVLAHEVAHVVEKHGLGAISAGRKASALKILVRDVAKAFSQEDVKALSGMLEGSVNDIADTMLKSGYGKGKEKDADRLGCIYAARAGYDPNGLARFIEAMKRREGVAQGGTFATHPDADSRLEIVRETIAEEKLAPEGLSGAPGRTARFKEATAVLGG